MEASKNEGRLAGADPGPPGWLVEGAVVGAALALLCTFGIPALHSAVERGRARDAFDYLAAVSIAQERFQLRHDAYALRLCDLDLHAEAPAWFDVLEFEANRARERRGGWFLTLARRGRPAGYGGYTITFNERGFDAARSTVDRYFDTTAWVPESRT